VDWIADPQAMRPGTRMPSLLGHLPEEEARVQAADIAAFLIARGGSFRLDPVEVQPVDLARGEELWKEVGCFACHGDQLEGRPLAAMTSVAALRDQLLEPHVGRPSGLMPDMHLDEGEATALAAWLLRAQASTTEEQMVPGLHWKSFDYTGEAQEGPDWATAKILDGGITPDLDVALGGDRASFGLVFEGQLLVPEDGVYAIYLASDDGSTLSLDGKVLIDGRHHQSHTRRDVEIHLVAGLHPLRITYYEAGGDQSLEGGWSSDLFEERPWVSEDFRHRGEIFLPLPGTRPPSTADSVSIARGQQLYSSLGCVRCHEPSAPSKVQEQAPDWFDLSGEGGCLELMPREGVPHFAFTRKERLVLQRHLEKDALWLTTGPQASRTRHALQAYGCIACHEHGLAGVPREEVMRLFSGSGDLGDEGRIPPTLDGVESKLQAHWLGEVIQDGASVRPYMHTRMPAFGENAGGFVTGALLAMAPSEAAALDDPFDREVVEMGKDLAGTGGFACISCHRLAGHRSVGIQGLDLATVGQRLRRDWFEDWLANPHGKRATTRMPVYWDADGQSAVTKFGDGRADIQIEALWEYLSLGPNMPLPEGLIPDSDAFRLVPMQHPIYFGTFMEGLSARVLTVGFPERVHLAFDQHHVRLAKYWRGDFMDAEGTWSGRAGQLELPAGLEVRDLPPGPAFAFVGPEEAWPTEDPKRMGWRMRGHRRDGDEYPTFRYGYGTLEVEETLIPELDASGPFLRRIFALRSEESPEGLVFRTLDRDGKPLRRAVSFQKEGGIYTARWEEELR
jgi:cytochrome c553